MSKAKTDKSSMSDYGTPEEFLDSISNYFGQQSYSGIAPHMSGYFDMGADFCAVCSANNSLCP